LLNCYGRTYAENFVHVGTADALKELSAGSGKSFPLWLYWWLRIAVPVAILIVGLNWLLESVF
jgi:hypothetical protein